MPVRNTPIIGGGMLHLGISSARNPFALRVGLHSRLKSGIRILVAVSATSKCRGLIPRLFLNHLLACGLRASSPFRRSGALVMRNNGIPLIFAP